MWQLFPGCAASGLAMNVTLTPWLSASAFIACSDGTNGLSDPHRQVLRCDRGEVLGLIRGAAKTAAAVIVTPHWGREYIHTPGGSQKALARAMVAAGATAIVGAHPHAIQPWEWLDGPRGPVLTIYSLGNFVSGQFQSLTTRTGLLAWLELCPAAGGLRVRQTAWLPLVMHMTAKGPWMRPAGSRAAGVDGQARALAARLLPGPTVPMDLRCSLRGAGPPPSDAPEIALAGKGIDLARIR